MSPVLLLFVGSTLVAFLVAVITAPIVASLSHRFRVLDIPGGRRHHPRPIPRPGGLAIAAGLAPRSSRSGSSTLSRAARSSSRRRCARLASR